MTGFGMAEVPRQVAITASPTGAQILLGDTDVSEAIDGYQIEQRAGHPPTVVLYTQPGSPTAFQGLARVVVAEPAGTPGETIAGFLSAIDPAALDAAVLDRTDLDGGRHELTAAMLRTLADWALGKAV